METKPAYSDMKSKVQNLARLLKQKGGSDFWAEKLISAVEQSNGNIVQLSESILSDYGGMGALNDWVFYTENQSLRHLHEKQNKEFNLLLWQIAEVGMPYLTNELTRKNVASRAKTAKEISGYTQDIKK